MLLAALLTVVLQAPAPVVVDGTPITLAAIDARARAMPEWAGETRRTRRTQAADELIDRVWVEAEAARRGVAVTEAQLDAAWAREEQLAGGPPQFAHWLEARGKPAAEFRRDLRTEALRRRLADAVLAETDDADGYGLEYRLMAERLRAATTCARTRVVRRSDLADRCGNVRQRRSACQPAGLIEVCWFAKDRSWDFYEDLVPHFGGHTNHRAERLLRAALPRSVRRQLDWDSEADAVAAYTPSRTAIRAVARAVNEIMVRRNVPVPSPGLLTGAEWDAHS